MSSKSNLDLGHGRIIPLLLHFAWPAVVTMLLSQLYNIVDRIYIGNGCGPDAIAGLALTFPLMGALVAIGVLIGVDSSSILSIQLGENDMRGAEQTLGQCVAMKILFGIIFPPLMFFFGMDPLLNFMVGSEGATPETIHLARQYLEITLFFNLFSHLAFGLSATMRAEGAPRPAMWCMVVGFAANLILDPIFIFAFGWGVAGAAWATNISMVLSCGVALHHYLGGHSVVKLRLECIRIYPRLARRALAIGLSPCTMQILGATVSFAATAALTKWSPNPESGSVQIAALGICMTIPFLFHIPIMGVQQGCAPIVGFGWGARDYKRVLETLDKGLVLTTLCSCFGCLCMEVFARILSRAFTDDNAVIEASVRAMRLSNVMIWTISINVAATTYFQAVGRPKPAILLSILRQGCILLPLIIFMPMVMSDHILGIWLAFPISDVVTQIATLPPLLKERRWLKRSSSSSSSSSLSLEPCA